MDKLKNFMANIGVMCETWMVAYNNFAKMGLEQKDALAHTQAFMSAFMTSAIQNNGGKE